MHKEEEMKPYEPAATETDIPALMARISELEILVAAWQSQAQSANEILGFTRRELNNAKHDRTKAWDIIAQKDREIEALMQQIIPAGVPPEAENPKIISLTERVFTRFETHENPTFCPQCGMVMDSQCGAKCYVCGFKSSCSMEPT